MPQFSFDVVSEVDQQEVDNALNQARKEIDQRYDFKGSNSKIDWNAKEWTITLHTADDMKLRAITEILNGKMIKRGISQKVLSYEKIEQASGGTLRQNVKIKHGLESEQAKVVTKLIKDLKLKVQSAIQGDAVRVTGKSKDDLQEAMQTIRASTLEFPVQFTNFR